ncbi:MAG: hypothetical protein FK732_03465, partial [Asgard group archaeon]|nr:hypothetical protein [Asgard group archaeon]
MQDQLLQQARALSREERKKILMSCKELELHQYLKELFIAMEPTYIVEITHRSDELGKDLVIVKYDKFTTDVIGVVVKRGDIRAKTAGDVDELKTNIQKILYSDAYKTLKEIESQIDQAFEYPAEIKTGFRKLKVTNVFVVLAGEISNPARRRLESELKGNIEIFDIQRLIDEFTDYYPQIFFEGKTIDFLQEHIQKLETTHSLSKRHKNLSEYFVEPLVATIDSPIALNGEQLPLFIQEQRIPFSKLQAVLKEHEHIILVGDPGTGKSGALAKMSIDLFRKGYKLLTRNSSKNKQQVEIPILVTAKDVLQADDVYSILDNYFPAQAIRERFIIQTLMVDALDEIPSLCRNEVIEKAKAFSEKLSCSLIITSRKIDIVKTSPEGFKKVELLPFEFGQACTLLEKVLAEPQKLTAIKDELERIQFQLPLIPLSLMLIVELIEQNKEIPASVTEIYDRFHDIALGRWDQEKGIEVLFEYYIKKFFLASLAYNEFLTKKRLEIEREEFEKAYEHYAKQYTWDTETL